ncbi:DNA polymerase IV [Paracraurococcus ruber]|uniref:DNA polymerase IV n=1 Tax=Paracraurococcus ruber TaxID=77675 RepID=UPI001F010DEA|nr:DNA polymerase IV [Paracraurococcus ruber]
MTAAIRKICHVDLDAFYASVEQRDDPALRGRPVAVGGSRERGVVAAASYEARRFGVRSAMPSLQAVRLCPDLVFVKPRFEVYRTISRQIRDIYESYTPLVEPLSLDEAYLDVTENRKGMPYASQVAAAIRAEILAETGLTASAGVSYNKFLAKLASDHRKPNGQFVITPAMGPDFVAGLAVARFHGVGPATAAKMQALGIRTGADLRACSLAFLQQHFGKAGAHFHAIAQAVDERPVRPDRPRKSSGSETTYAQDLRDPAQVEDGIRALAAEVWAWCDTHRWSGRTVTLKLRYADFRTLTRSRTRAAAIAGQNDLTAIAIDLARGLFPLAKPVRLLGVTISTADDQAQPALDFEGGDASLGHPPPGAEGSSDPEGPAAPPAGG